MAATPRGGGTEQTGQEQRQAGAQGLQEDVGGTQGGGELAGQQSRGMQRRSGGEGAVARPSALSPIMQLTQEMDRLMDLFFGRGPTGRRGRGAEAGALWVPRVDMRQRGNNLVVDVEIPGARDEDVRIDITDDGLAVYGELADERTEEDESFSMIERRYGSFYRVIPLPVGARAEEAKAQLRNGVLRIMVPLEAGRPQRRQIPIGSGGTQGGGAEGRGGAQTCGNA
ncbi:MAG TPA: Hsp20/alpha crystallin family protein [Steroidobacteraceae bacterium]|nr:Hsp20/alpha crystallin family protein [Steroidobacteraceae bacterium]